MSIEFLGVTKFYGDILGVNDLTFQIGPGITGLVGSNGAGKSTLIKLASGQLRPSLGSIRIHGHPPRSIASRWFVGYCPDTESVFEYLTARKFLLRMAALYGYSRRESSQRVERALELVDMTSRGDRKLAGCSHGMRQRIKLAQAILHDPTVLLLDEPHLGIDPGGRRHLNELLVKLAAEGKTVLVSSHLLTELERLADQIIFMGRGRLIAAGTLAEIRKHLNRQPVIVECSAEPLRDAAAKFAYLDEVLSVEVSGNSLMLRTLDAEGLFRQIERMVLAGEFALHRMQILDANAQAVYGYLEQGISA